MSATKEIHPYALRLPMAKARELAAAQGSTGLSVNQLILLCLDKALSDVVTALAPVKRVTNVDPLTPEELETLYRNRVDDTEGVSPKALAAFQSQEEPK